MRRPPHNPERWPIDPTHANRFRVALQDEHGKTIDDPIDVPSNRFPVETDSRFVCLRFVDPYGDTLFNRIQAEYLEADLRLLSRECRDPGDGMLIERVISLVSACRAEPHRYVKFIGD
jgi:hypothetical protein